MTEVPIAFRFAVRDLADFVYRSGDLYTRFDATATAEEGVATQRALQRDCEAGYRREVPVRHEVAGPGFALSVLGRADGVLATDDAVQVDEYKCTRADPVRVHGAQGAVHGAQLKLYAYLLSLEMPDRISWKLRLIYAHPDSLATTAFEETLERDDLAGFFQSTCARLFDWLSAQREHIAARAAFARGLRFPYERFRPHQRTVARRVYRALRDGESLLLEAPTGSGKTLATLYPAVKLLAADPDARVFYLTAKTTGQGAAERATGQLSGGAHELRTITVTAKEKCCPVPGMPCDPARCAYAQGYFDRRPAAVRELLARGNVDPDTAAAVAERHRVCPFELALDAARWADVVILDYNYLFDPVVRLRRFAALGAARLLIDEAHQLVPRVAGMLTVEIARDAACAAAEETLTESLRRRVEAVVRAVDRVRKSAAGVGELVECPRPVALVRALERFTRALPESDVDLARAPELKRLYLDALRFLRVHELAEEVVVRAFVTPARPGARVRLQPLDPADYLRRLLAGYGGHVRFSGSVSPPEVYQRLHGLADGTFARAPPAFAATQLDVCIVPDVSTYYRHRDVSLGQLCTLVAGVQDTRPGRHFVVLPSFDYLNRFAAGFRERFPGMRLLDQRPEMDDAARLRFLADVQDGPQPVLAAVVLGGVFTESIELSGRGLDGLVVVGIGYPPRTEAALATQAYFEDAGEDGHCVAFEQPAMTRVVQAAGRLLRSPTDCGLLCLVDPRFLEPRYQRFFPAYWQPVTVRSDRLRAHLTAGRRAASAQEQA